VTKTDTKYNCIGATHMP